MKPIGRRKIESRPKRIERGKRDSNEPTSRLKSIWINKFEIKSRFGILALYTDICVMDQTY